MMKAFGSHKLFIYQNLGRDLAFIGNGGSTESKSFGFTIIELIITLAIIGVLAGIAIPAYTGYRERENIGLAISDLEAISLKIDSYMGDNGIGPDSLAAVRYDNYLDPWGNPYQYFNIKTAKGKGKMRKDRFLVPINTYYDLYSMGPDGQSVSPLTAKASRDDIIRANDGAYFGPAAAF
jgi:general secretion pathway protein G